MPIDSELYVMTHHLYAYALHTYAYAYLHIGSVARLDETAVFDEMAMSDET